MTDIVKWDDFSLKGKGPYITKAKKNTKADAKGAANRSKAKAASTLKKAQESPAKKAKYNAEINSRGRKATTKRTETPMKRGQRRPK